MFDCPWKTSTCITRNPNHKPQTKNIYIEREFNSLRVGIKNIKICLKKVVLSFVKVKFNGPLPPYCIIYLWIQWTPNSCVAAGCSRTCKDGVRFPQELSTEEEVD